jgi:hypothetical protein
MKRSIPAYVLEKNDAGYHAGGCDNYRGGGDHKDAEIRRKVVLAAMAAVRRRHRSWFGETKLIGKKHFRGRRPGAARIPYRVTI